ncbi:hypothetical protein GCM10027051_10830 [Niabella terrae]
MAIDGIAPASSELVKEEEALDKDAQPIALFSKDLPDPEKPVGQMMVKKAELELEVKNNAGFKKSLQQLLEQKAAYISEETATATDNWEQHHLVVKIPVDAFDAFLIEVKALDVKTVRSSMHADDVTAGYIDTRARLKTRQATRDQYISLLQKATQVDDVLKIRQELNNIQEDIEAAQARLQQLSGAASYSSLQLTYFEPRSGYSSFSRQAGLGMRIGKAVRNGGALFADILVGLITLWPVWLGLLTLLLLLRFFFKKKKPLRIKTS